MKTLYTWINRMYINLTQIHIYSDTKKTCNIGIIQKNVLQAI